ncbi:MAG TPA: ABC transporter permease [Planctomycetota bacterium]|jgi:putative ABC transport system permease protein
MMRLLPWEYAVRNLGRAPLRMALSMGGCGIVVLLVLASVGFVRGMQKSLTFSGGTDNVILLSAGSEESIERSEIDGSIAGTAAASISGIRERLGVKYISPEFHAAPLVYLERNSPERYMALMRGIRPEAFLVHPQVRIVEGHAPGTGEILVGHLAATRMGVPNESLEVGKQLWFDNRAWTVAGHFEAPGTVMEAEIWIPLTDLQIAMKRESKFSCVIMTLGSAELGDVQEFVKRRPDLELVAFREADYYGKLMTFFRPVQTMVWIATVLLAMGGLLGGLNTMYAAFASRVRELGSLQALGFKRRAIVLSLVQESVLTAVVGTLIAAVIGLALLNGVGVRFSMGAFRLMIDAPALATGFAAGAGLGLLGALPPAWRCLRMPIPDALKSA